MSSCGFGDGEGGGCCSRFCFNSSIFFFTILEVLFRLLVLRRDLQTLLVMLERVRPILQLFVILLLRLASLVKGVAEIIMALALQPRIR